MRKYRSEIIREYLKPVFIGHESGTYCLDRKYILFKEQRSQKNPILIDTPVFVRYNQISILYYITKGEIEYGTS